MSSLFHFSATPISRSAGRSATGAVAYRAGMKLEDERTGISFDYSKKSGVLNRGSDVLLPGGASANCSEFWNAVEKHHKRGDAVVARETEASLPSSLPPQARQQLAEELARALADEYGVGVQMNLHAPRPVTDKMLEEDPDQYWEIDKDTGQRHNGNWHAHFVLSACSADHEGKLGKKVAELDPIHCQRANIENFAEKYRPIWAEMTNQALIHHKCSERVDHRSLEEQGIDRSPTKHHGPNVAAIERDAPGKSQVLARIDLENEAEASVALAPLAVQKEVAELKKELATLETQLEKRDGLRNEALRAIDQNVGAADQALGRADSSSRRAGEACEHASPAPGEIERTAQNQHARSFERDFEALGDWLGRAARHLSESVASIARRAIGTIKQAAQLAVEAMRPPQLAPALGGIFQATPQQSLAAQNALLLIAQRRGQATPATVKTPDQDFIHEAFTKRGMARDSYNVLRNPADASGHYWGEKDGLHYVHAGRNSIAVYDRDRLKQVPPEGSMMVFRGGHALDPDPHKRDRGLTL